MGDRWNRVAIPQKFVLNCVVYAMFWGFAELLNLRNVWWINPHTPTPTPNPFGERANALTPYSTYLPLPSPPSPTHTALSFPLRHFYLIFHLCFFPCFISTWCLPLVS